LRDWIFKSNRRNRFVDWWALDAWIDSSIYNAWARFSERWADYNAFFQRFEVTGFRKFMVELISESAHVGMAGLVVVLTFGLYSIEAANNPAWRTASEYSVTFLDRYGNEVGKRGVLRSDAVPLEQIPDHLIKAVLATEDRRFFEHFGVDIIGTVRAMIANARAHVVVQGGSSLTQQLAKNIFLTSERSIDRKIKEAYLALWLEARLTKQEILKLYLDRSYLGGGAFGVEAASQFYFGKSVRDINLAEAAVLAGLFKAPTKYAPHVNPLESRLRANDVLTNMVDAGFMTEGQVHGARLNPAKVVERANYESPDWFLDWAFEETQRLTRKTQERSLIVRTTVDVNLQKAAQQAIQTALDQNSKSRHVSQAALVAMEKDGAVRAMIGGRDYGDSQFNRATHGHRQPGSSFKPYVYLTALEHGFTPSTMVVDGPVSCGHWSPKNYSGGYRGRMPLRDALKRSINTVAVKLSLSRRTGGREALLANLKKLGLSYVKKTCSMALGDTGVTPLDHTSGFAVFANGGKSVKAYGVTEIRNAKGDLLYSHDRDEPKPKRIFERRYVEELNTMLRAVVTEGTGRAADLDFTNAVGKTGTSSDYHDAWFMGFTGQYVAGVWMGNDNSTSMARVTGGGLPAPTWRQFMIAAHSSYNIPQIPGLPMHPKQVEELQRIAEMRKADPSLGGMSDSSRKMPLKTQRLLTRLSKLLKEKRATLIPVGQVAAKTQPAKTQPAKTQPAAPAKPHAQAAARARRNRTNP
jgi:penicillin-binding protein 1A